MSNNTSPDTMRQRALARGAHLWCLKARAKGACDRCVAIVHGIIDEDHDRTYRRQRKLAAERR